MNITHPLGNEVSKASFSCYTSEEIKKLSVKEIVDPIIFDAVGIPNEGGLYDPALGPFTHSAFCGTCNLDFYRCPGHFGHIELPVPVYNPLFFVHSLALLRSICLECHHFKLNLSLTFQYTAKLKLLKHGLLLESQMVDGIDQFVKMSLKKGDEKHKLTAIIAERKKIILEFLHTCSKIKQCGRCGSFSASFKKEGYSKIFRKQLSIKYQKLQGDHFIKSRKRNSPAEEIISENDEVDNNTTSSKFGNEFITPGALRDHFLKLFVNESELCTMLYCAQGLLSDVMGFRHKSPKAVNANMFFIDVVAVPPTRFRPANIVHDKTMENPQNEHLIRILNARQGFLNYAAKMNECK
ncbi:9708_t:CDS:2, partial [Funneliformis geosporum]